MSGITTITVERRKYKVGYIVKKQLWTTGNEEPIPINAAFNLKGQYIGDPKTARYLIKTRGIKPIKASKDKNICTIGFCKRDRKWYGWSHRAIFGFGIGDKLFEENYKSELPDEKRNKISFIKHGSRTIKNMRDAKQAAINFAASVS